MLIASVMLMRLIAILGVVVIIPATLRGSPKLCFLSECGGFEKDDDIVFCHILQEMDINLKIGLMIHNGDCT